MIRLLWGYVRDEQLFLDLRTIRDDEVGIVGDAIKKGVRG